MDGTRSKMCLSGRRMITFHPQKGTTETDLEVGPSYETSKHSLPVAYFLH